LIDAKFELLLKNYDKSISLFENLNHGKKWFKSMRKASQDERYYYFSVQLPFVVCLTETGKKEHVDQAIKMLTSLRNDLIRYDVPFFSSSNIIESTLLKSLERKGDEASLMTLGAYCTN